MSLLERRWHQSLGKIFEKLNAMMEEEDHSTARSSHQPAPANTDIIDAINEAKVEIIGTFKELLRVKEGDANEEEEEDESEDESTSTSNDDDDDNDGAKIAHKTNSVSEVPNEPTEITQKTDSVSEGAGAGEGKEGKEVDEKAGNDEGKGKEVVQFKIFSENDLPPIENIVKMTIAPKTNGKPVVVVAKIHRSFELASDGATRKMSYTSDVPMPFQYDRSTTVDDLWDEVATFTAVPKDEFFLQCDNKKMDSYRRVAEYLDAKLDKRINMMVRLRGGMGKRAKQALPSSLELVAKDTDHQVVKNLLRLQNGEFQGMAHQASEREA